MREKFSGSCVLFSHCRNCSINASGPLICDNTVIDKAKAQSRRLSNPSSFKDACESVSTSHLTFHFLPFLPSFLPYGWDPEQTSALVGMVVRMGSIVLSVLYGTGGFQIPRNWRSPEGNIYYQGKQTPFQGDRQSSRSFDRWLL
jgi:hypothetical protein